MTDKETSSDVSRIIPSKGYVGAYLNLGIAELSYSRDQDGVRSGGFTRIGVDVVSIDGHARHDWYRANAQF